MSHPYDAILVVGFGGPEGREDVIPFLENVLRGRNVPRERMLEVAEHYYHFDGVSPINQQVRDLLDVLKPELREHGIELPVYWGNRNWHPMLADTMQQMIDDGVKRAIALVLSSFSSYSGCRQYREDIGRAQEAVGKQAPAVDKLRVWYNHPDFISANVDCVRRSLEKFTVDTQESSHIAFTAHSIPKSMADHCRYEEQLTETCRLIADELAIAADRWQLVYQSRSGRPQDPWLEPDICDHLRNLNAIGVENVIAHPVGFLSDHMEVLYDLDDEAAKVSQELGMHMERAPTVGIHPTFVSMLRKLIAERLDESMAQEAIGQFGPSHNVCPIDCCPAPVRLPSRPAS
ncbi:MAG: ferrochelatase [Planctomycetaceae bacterium]|nr:ferrochelatase [Planctomycetaceae bacterium]